MTNEKDELVVETSESENQELTCGDTSEALLVKEADILNQEGLNLKQHDMIV